MLKLWPSPKFDMDPSLFVEPQVVSLPRPFRMSQLKIELSKNCRNELVDLADRYLGTSQEFEWYTVRPEK